MLTNQTGYGVIVSDSPLRHAFREAGVEPGNESVDRSADDRACRVWILCRASSVRRESLGVGLHDQRLLQFRRCAHRRRASVFRAPRSDVLRSDLRRSPTGPTRLPVSSSTRAAAPAIGATTFVRTIAVSLALMVRRASSTPLARVFPRLSSASGTFESFRVMPERSMHSCPGIRLSISIRTMSAVSSLSLPE